ncbi:MAG: DUF5662 family protein [Oscillospiraceae bacterium]|nr:DUF5662 family protein [Oscillospiraceae bacterium]
MHLLGHFKTITHHKLLVMGYCFRVGLIRQGLMHDMSKYSLTELRVGAKYYTGTKSPNALEREELGYSTAWLHHKGRNRHHLEYWIDYGGRDFHIMGHPMPTKYMVELCLDRIAACRVYHGKNYTDRDPLDYLVNSRDSRMMHPVTKAQVVEILTMLAEKGEKETLRYIRRVVLKHAVALYPSLPEPEGDPAEKDPCFLSGNQLKELADELGTPFYLYDEKGIVETSERLKDAFSWANGYRNFFPVKATPTAGILKLLREHGHGVVCSSAAELELCRRCGFKGDEILFLPNYPREEDLAMAEQVPCMPVLDDLGLLSRFLNHGLLRGTVGIRVKPDGMFRFGLTEVSPDSMKFGVTASALKAAIPKLKEAGIRSMGLHSYMAGNTMSPEYYPRLTAFLCDLALELSRDIQIDYINISGGIGIAYRPGQQQMDLAAAASAVKAVFQEKLTGSTLVNPGLYTELGRFVTGPHGVLVTRVTHIKEEKRTFAGVDASSADLMRPMMYGAYHHISVAGKECVKDRKPYDVVGAVCENTDKLAENRMLPALEAGDVLAIHDAGAHGHSMGYQYGGRLRSGEYLLHPNGEVQQLRRPETIEDYLSTQVF